MSSLLDLEIKKWKIKVMIQKDEKTLEQDTIVTIQVQDGAQNTGHVEIGDMKRCGTCLLEKDLKDFYNDKSKKDGKASKCIDCKKTKKQANKCLECKAKIRLNQCVQSKYCSNCRVKHGYCFNCQKENQKLKYGICLNCYNNSKNITCFCCNKITKQRASVDSVCSNCYRFLRTYNLSKEKYVEILSIKKCQICEIDLDFSKGNSPNRGVIDHCHKTKKIRGMICYKCNIIEGMIRDFNHLERFYKKYKSWTNVANG
jgi:hypothetical protein